MPPYDPDSWYVYVTRVAKIDHIARNKQLR